MELRDALAQIDEIRQTMARGQVCRGYRSATIASSGMLVLLGAASQARWLPANLTLEAYLILWLGIAAVCAALIVAELLLRRRASSLQTQVNVLAVEQFLPSLVAGALLTYVIGRYAPASAWMLPGLWAVLFGLGIYASCRLLPRATFWVAGYYLLSGLACLVLAQGDHAFSPWAMAGTFGVGQLLAAATLYWNLERHHGQET